MKIRHFASALVAADIPSLDAAKIATGTIAAARLGSGSGGSSKFLREDSTWQTVSLSPAGSNTQLQYNSSGSFGASSSLTFNGTTLQVGSAGKLTSPNSSTIFLGATPGGSYSGTDNVILGAGAGVAITSGTLNVLAGSRAGEAISTGTGNLLFGYAAGYGITTGSYNTGFGYACLAGNQSYSVALGTNALGSGTGTYNVGIGYRAGIGLTTGYFNTLIGGDYAGGVVSSGIGNSCVGWFAGSNITTGSYNCAIGYNTQVDSATASYQTNINDTFVATSSEARISGRDLKIENGKNLVFGTSTGTKIGTSASQKIGFFNVTPVVQQTITGVTEQQQIDSIVDALAALGLITDAR